MSRVYLLVEGQTEEVFVNELLAHHYARQGIYLTPIIVNTSAGYKGDVVNYAKIRPQIDKLCRDSPHKAPSKRILAAMSDYRKTFHGPLIACDIGLDAMRQECPHFAGWLRKLEALNGL